ncbi:MAG: tyrosine--tRNA ligase, partial [Thermofilaceae archaeon]
PPREVELNPVLELAKYILFRERKHFFRVPSKKSGNVKEFNTFYELADAYTKGEIHPLDLKLAVAEELSGLLEPVYKYFREGSGYKYLEELSEITITR